MLHSNKQYSSAPSKWAYTNKSDHIVSSCSIALVPLVVHTALYVPQFLSNLVSKKRSEDRYHQLIDPL